MIRLGSKSRTAGPIAIDLGAHSIRLLQLAKGTKGRRVLAAAEAPFYDSDAGADPTLATQSKLIQKTLSEGGFLGRRVITALPLRAVRIKSFRLPCMPPEELAGAIHFEALERFQANDADHLVQYVNAGKVSSGHEEQYEIISMIAARSTVDAHLSALSEMGLISTAIDFGPAALARIIPLPIGESDGTHLILDIGHSGTRVTLARPGCVTFVKLLDIGIHRLECAVAKKLQVTIEAAATMLRQPPEAVLTADNSPEEHIAVADAIKPELDTLCKDVSMCVRYFSLTFRCSTLDHLWFVGGGAHVAVVTEAIAGAVNAPCEVLPVLGSFVVPGELSGFKPGPAWATAAGLALREVGRRSSQPAVEVATT